MKRGDELQLEIIDAAFEEPEACKNNTRSVFLFYIREYCAKTR